MAIWILVHVGFWLRYVRPIRDRRGKRAAGAAVAASAVLAPVVIVLDRAIETPPWMQVVRWALYLDMGLVAVVFFLTLAREIVWGGAWIADRASRGKVLPQDPERRAFLTNAVNLGVLGASGGLTGLGFVQARSTPDVTEVEVPIRGLPPALDGFRIVQLTDVHVGPTIRRDWIRDVVEVANRLRPDLIAVTGDLVDGSVDELRPHTAPLADLRSRHGTFFVTGNHEYYSGAEEWVRECVRLGMTVLENEHRILEHEGARLLVGGVTDPTSGTSDPAKAMRGAPAALGAKILLAHQPKSIRAAARAGFDLQLSGHTHGGQFIPWNFLVPLAQPFTKGLNRLGQTWCYVSCGTGYWGPPLRLGVPSEVTLLELRVATG